MIHCFNVNWNRFIDRVGVRLKLRKAQAETGDIVLLFSDESEALTHPYLARACRAMIERAWLDLKANHLAHQTFTDLDDLDQAIHNAVTDLNAERNRDPLANPRISA